MIDNNSNPLRQLPADAETILKELNNYLSAEMKDMFVKDLSVYFSSIGNRFTEPIDLVELCKANNIPYDYAIEIPWLAYDKYNISEFIEWFKSMYGLSAEDIKVADSEEYSLVEETPWKYSVEKDGKHWYTLTKNDSGKWACTCPAYYYHHKCKHVQMLANQLSQATDRLPQHLARVRQLEKSLEIWTKRLEENPNSKIAKKNVDERTKALEEAKKKADEIESMPKPTRHPRSEFEGAIPAIDKLFQDIGPYDIVGSWARKKDTYKDVDILTPLDRSGWNKLKERLENDPNFVPAPGHTHIDFGDEVIRGGYVNGDRVDYLDINRVSDVENYGAWSLFRIGSAQFNIACRGWLKKFGCGLSEKGIKKPDGSYIKLPTQESFFENIGIPYIEPEDRETAQKFYQEVRKINIPKFLEETE